MRIRRARRDDARAIARVHVASWRAAYRGLLPQSYLDRMSTTALAQRWRDREAVWVAEVDGKVVGFSLLGPCRHDAALAGFAGEVTMLYVHADYTGDGFGQALLELSLDELARQQYFWVVVWVVEGNRAARSFYERRGLRLDGARRDDEFDGTRVPVVRYAAPLNPAFDFARLFAVSNPF